MRARKVYARRAASMRPGHKPRKNLALRIENAARETRFNEAGA